MHKHDRRSSGPRYYTLNCLRKYSLLYGTCYVLSLNIPTVLILFA